MMIKHTLLIAACLLLPGQKALAVQPNDAKPWTFWYWMYGAVTREGIHADLVSMHQAGLGGFYLMPIKSAELRPEYGGKANQLSPEFWNMVDYSLQQADSLGLGVGIHVCDGFALAGGPWVTPDKSMQRVVWTDTIVSSLTGIKIGQPEAYQGYYRDIACMALPLKSGQTAICAEPKAVGGTIVRNDKGIFFSKQAGHIDFTFAQPTTFRAIEITPQSANIQCQRFTVLASDDGLSWRKVAQMQPPRQGWQSNGNPFTFAIEPTIATHIRLAWTPEGSEPGSEELDQAKWNPTLKLERVRFLTLPFIDDYEGKNGSEWRVSAPTTTRQIADADCFSPSDVVMLQGTDGIYSPVKPLGKQKKGQKWLVLRFGHTATGMTNATGGGARGLECDKFSAEAATLQFNNWYGRFLKLPHASAVTHFHIDSWECGTQNWGSDFAAQFQLRRGYDLMPWLPVMAGIPMLSADKSEQVLRDVRLTVNDLVNERFFLTLTRLAKANGKTISHESIAPTFVADGLEHYKYSDNPMGEYWLNSPTHDKPNDMLDAVSGAHVYGKNIVQAEGFTEVRGVWDETPASLKALLDRNFCWGMNKLVFHVNALNPWTDRRPGMTLDGIGLFFQRDNTWYPLASGLTGYVERCQRLLQMGSPVADVAVFMGEEMPRRALTPDKLVSFLPGLFGPERVKAERERLANAGNPMTESPVGVRHNANIFSLDTWNNPLHGYQYDSMNPDILLHGTATSGKLLGKYSIIVVPQGRNVSATINERLRQLSHSGVRVVDSVFSESDFRSLGVLPDVVLPEGIGYTHRHVEGWGEVYFLSNQTGKEVSFCASFRDGKALSPTLYDPLTDRYYQLSATADGLYPVSLAANGSVFVLFTRQPVAEAMPLPQPSATQEIGGEWQLRFLTTGVEQKVTLPNDWTESPDQRIKYYSGMAEYSTTFKFKGKPQGNVILKLPEGGGLVAQVEVNGSDCGVAWTPPYTVDITKMLRRGNNSLRITVANTWRNALLGADNGTPPFDGIWTNGKYRRKDNHLDPSGLLGKVVLKY